MSVCITSELSGAVLVWGSRKQLFALGLSSCHRISFGLPRAHLVPDFSEDGEQPPLVCPKKESRD